MKHVILMIAILLGTVGGAEAQTAPATGQLYFVGSSQELFKIRAALRTLLDEESVAHGYGGFPNQQHCMSAPFNRPDPTCFLLNDGPLVGSNETVDCAESWYRGPGTPWNDGSDYYLGQSVLVDVDPTAGVDEELIEIPLAGTLVGPEDLPQVCKDALIDLYWCGGTSPLDCGI